jgi:hypothetical protein
MKMELTIDTKVNCIFDWTPYETKDMTTQQLPPCSGLRDLIRIYDTDLYNAALSTNISMTLCGQYQ